MLRGSCAQMTAGQWVWFEGEYGYLLPGKVVEVLGNNTAVVRRVDTQTTKVLTSLYYKGGNSKVVYIEGQAHPCRKFESSS